MNTWSNTMLTEGKLHYSKFKDYEKARSISNNQRFKIACMEYHGTKCCSRCGYDKCPRALHFHHKDRNEKEFNISQVTKSVPLRDNVKAELDKCELLCANCHYEIEDGM